MITCNAFLKMSLIHRFCNIEGSLLKSLFALFIALLCLF